LKPAKRKNKSAEDERPEINRRTSSDGSCEDVVFVRSPFIFGTFGFTEDGSLGRDGLHDGEEKEEEGCGVRVKARGRRGGWDGEL
jgi:hypothetical protein